MSEVMEHEYDDIDTIGRLRVIMNGIENIPDEMPLRDCFGEPLLLQIITDTETGEKYVTIR